MSVGRRRSVTLTLLLAVLLALLAQVSQAAVAQRVPDLEALERVLQEKPWLARNPDGSIPAVESLTSEEIADAAQLYVEDLGIPADEAETRVRRNDAYYPIAALAQELAGPLHGGSWLDQEGGTINIAYDGSPTAATALQNTVSALLVNEPSLASFAQDVRVAAVQHTFQELSELYYATYEDRRELERLTGGAVLLSVDVPVNALTVRVEKYSEEIAAQLEDLLGPAARVEQLPPEDIGEQSCTQLNCQDDPTMRGGIDINACTTGFVAYNSQGQRYILTAGHCFEQVAPNNEAFHFNTTRDRGYVGYAPVVGTEGPNVDAARVLITNWASTYWVFFSPSAQRLQMEARVSSAWFKVNGTGSGVYLLGKNISKSSGTVQASLAQVGQNVSQGFTYNNDGCLGDSGGSIVSYPQAWALGVHSLITGTEVYTRNGERCRASGGASHIIDAEQGAGNVFVLTN